MWKVRLWWKELRERFYVWLAWHVLPRELVKWAAIRVMVNGVPASEAPYSVTVADALRRWESA